MKKDITFIAAFSSLIPISLAITPLTIVPSILSTPAIVRAESSDDNNRALIDVFDLAIKKNPNNPV